MTGPSRVSSALLAFPLLALATPSAQSAADRGAQQPPIRTEATFVRVDVYPTRDGRPVPGLTKEDFEVFEDGVLQTVQTFEHIQIRSAGATLDVAEPASQREMLQEAANPRNRIFVIFLDVPHVSLAGSHAIIEPLIRLMNKMLGPDDLVGVMTPAMSVRDLVLGRRALVLEEALRRNWDWGVASDRTPRLSERENMYAICYPSRTSADLSPLAGQMIAKSRERMTLEALQDLVVYLHAIKEERKAIVAVSQGWRLYGETPEMMNIRDADPIPGREPITVGPTGTLTLGDKRNTNVSRTECEADRMRLASMDNERFFRDVLADANRSNASFYPIDPRGLSVSPAGVDTLRELADNTDGMAIVNTNDLDTGLQRIVDDLTSYYLLGYSSTNPKLDGRYRSLRVRVKQPGINVRARRGYRGPTPEEVTLAPAPPGAPGDGESSAALTRALGSLARIIPTSRLFVHAVVTEGTASGTGELWIAGELPRAAGPDAWAQGGQADVQVSGGSATGGAKVSFQRGQRAFVAKVALPRGADGPLDLRVRLTPEGGGDPLSELVRVEPNDAVGPLLYRAGPSTASRVVPAADPRFNRNERLRLELPVRAETRVESARVLDAAGKPLRVPVKLSESRDDATGQRWILGDVSLAPLAPADYVIELVTREGDTHQRLLAAIRVVR